MEPKIVLSHKICLLFAYACLKIITFPLPAPISKFVALTIHDILIFTLFYRKQYFPYVNNKRYKNDIIVICGNMLYKTTFSLTTYMV